MLRLPVSAPGSKLVRQVTVINRIAVKCRPCNVRYPCLCSEQSIATVLSFQKSTCIPSPNFMQVFVNDFRGGLIHDIDLYVVIYGMFIMLLAY